MRRTTLLPGQTKSARNLTSGKASALLAVLLAWHAASGAEAIPSQTIPFLPGECWWGGVVQDGPFMPFGEASYKFDLRPRLAGNQAAPLLLSNKGRYVWSERAFAFKFQDRTLLIENALAKIELGDVFNCPDLIGGGEISSFIKPGFSPDQELFVRTAQCSTMFPIMQFSIAPWRILDKEHFADCTAMVELRKRMGPEIVALAKDAARTGEPIMRPLAYDFPDGSYERIRDQFLLGPNMLVAPVLEKGAIKRTVVFPSGHWTGDDGSQVTGPVTREVDAPVSRLPWYRRN